MKKIITGFHAIEEILKSEKSRQDKKLGKKFEAEIVVSKLGPRVKKILALAKSLNINVLEKDKNYLNKLTKGLPEQLQDHRGIVLILNAEEKQFKISPEEFLARLKEKETATVAILDSISDPHNIGSILRSADQFAVDGIIVPANNSAGSFEVISKISSGASAWIPVISVNNLVRITEKLKKEGFWIYGADAGGKSVAQFDFPAKTALIMGNEGKGISRLLKDSCDEIISIPTKGRLDSLNVSVAAGILLYEISKNR